MFGFKGLRLVPSKFFFRVYLKQKIPKISKNIYFYSQTKEKIFEKYFLEIATLKKYHSLC